MVFSSNVFLFLFLPLTALVYYIAVIVPHKSLTFENIWLFLMSLLFYAWGEPRYVAVMVLSIIVNWFVGTVISRTDKIKIKKVILALGCVFNFLNLFVFKYLGWISGQKIKIALPIGISFYTFQAISYIVDVYRNGYTKEQTRFLNVGLYISFFPQLIAGPIVRYSTVCEQIKNRKHNVEKICNGAWRFFKGLVKKVLFANQLALITDKAFAINAENTVLFAWAGALASVLQIYYDFSGYSDMAIGLGKIFGFEFNENFNYPFASESLTEYWRRWHISLGEWFRDYLFYPLSLGFAIKFRKKLSSVMDTKKAASVSSALVLFIVWFSTGLWHGANYTFIIWGLAQFVIILFEQKIKPKKYLCHVKIALVCLLGTVMFNSDSVSYALRYYCQMFGFAGNKFADGPSVYWIGQFRRFFIAGIMFSLPLVPSLDKIVSKNKTYKNIFELIKYVVMTYLTLSAISVVIGSGYNPFLYFNF